MANSFFGRPMEIVLVEDSAADACMTMDALKKGHIRHRLTLIRDGEEAMQFLHRERWFARAPRPDLILLDLNLPRKDGLELLAEVRKEETLRSIPVVVLTASDAHEDMLRSQQLDVEGYLIKPVNWDKFIGLIKDLKSHWQADIILPLMD